MSSSYKILKRLIDLIGSVLGLILLGWLILILLLLASIDTKSYGMFSQMRVGYKGKLFKLYKIKTMSFFSKRGTITSNNRVTKLGKFFRRFKLDELPQLYNVFIGEMSLVGPRPDILGFADKLGEEDKIILNVKPGITGPASLYFIDEEKLLASQTNPEAYNRDIIWPKKVELNKAYVKNYSIFKDIKYLVKTIFRIR